MGIAFALLCGGLASAAETQSITRTINQQAREATRKAIEPERVATWLADPRGPRGLRGLTHALARRLGAEQRLIPTAKESEYAFSVMGDLWLHEDGQYATSGGHNIDAVQSKRIGLTRAGIRDQVRLLGTQVASGTRAPQLIRRPETQSR
jgi:hypothetical protein